MKKIKIYFGCALAYGPEEYKKEIASFKAELSAIPWVELFEFCVPPEGQKQSNLSPEIIYKVDIIDGVGSADVVLGDLSYPSSGLGGELGIAIREHKVRTMMFARRKIINAEGQEEENVVSKLWIGAPAHNPHASFQWYERNIKEMFDIILHELKRVHTIIVFRDCH
jgi:hypothetical protein